MPVLKAKILLFIISLVSLISFCCQSAYAQQEKYFKVIVTDKKTKGQVSGAKVTFVSFSGTSKAKTNKYGEALKYFKQGEKVAISFSHKSYGSTTTKAFALKNDKTLRLKRAWNGKGKQAKYIQPDNGGGDTDPGNPGNPNPGNPNPGNPGNPATPPAGVPTIPNLFYTLTPTPVGDNPGSTPTNTPAVTATTNPFITATKTNTPNPFITSTFTPTRTATGTPTMTGTATATRTATNTATVTNTATPTPLSPPSIVTDPVSAEIEPGKQVTFSVVANGSGPLYYQWQRNGVDVNGATNPSFTYTVTGHEQGSGGSNFDDKSTYRCRVSNSVNPAGVFSHPATLSVKLMASPDVPTGTPSGLRISVDGITNRGFPYNGSGLSAVIYLGSPARSRSIPIVLNWNEGNPAFRNKYQIHRWRNGSWQHIGDTSGNVTTYTTSISSGTSSGNTFYAFYIKGVGSNNSIDPGKSDTIFVDINFLAETPPSPLPVPVIYQPASPSVVRVPRGQYAKLCTNYATSSEPFYTGPPSFQWLRDGVEQSFSIRAWQNCYYTAQPGTYNAIASNRIGSAISPAYTIDFYTVVPEFVSHPQSANVASGTSVKLSCVAKGEGPFVYSWQKNGTTITGTNSATFVTPANTVSGDKFRCQVTTYGGTILSNEALITFN